MTIGRFPFVRSAHAVFVIFVLLVCGGAQAGSATYKYDSLGRLSEVAYGNGVVVKYAYDAAGNRVTDTTTGSLVTSPATAAVLASILEILLD